MRYLYLHEIVAASYGSCTYLADIGIQFNQFLVRDCEALLYHTGLKAVFPQVRAAVAKIVDPTALRWIAFSHFEADECGALNEFLSIAPDAQPLCSFVGPMVKRERFCAAAGSGSARQ